MKKTLAMVLAMGMTIASLTACGGSSAVETTAAAGTTAVAEDATTAAAAESNQDAIVLQVAFENSISEPIGQGVEKAQELLKEKSASEKIVLDSKKAYSNHFHTSGGNEAYSVMANTLRGIYGTDVLIATGNSFTGNVLKAGYTKKMVGSMIMPNSLSAYSSKMSGAELKETVKNFIEGYEGGFIPFNRGSLPVFSGISVEIKETDDGYTLSKVTKDGKKVQDNDTFTVTCLAIPKHMKAYPADENIVFDGADTTVKDTWTESVSENNAVLAEPKDYMTLR